MLRTSCQILSNHDPGFSSDIIFILEVIHLRGDLHIIGPGTVHVAEFISSSKDIGA
jgi:hypothetical protein